jgi:hypothetical protein
MLCRTSCVDELHQLPITSGVATGVADELSGVALATPGHPLESPLPPRPLTHRGLRRSGTVPGVPNMVYDTSTLVGVGNI